jgi:hypothetical protein
MLLSLASVRRGGRRILLERKPADPRIQTGAESDDRPERQARQRIRLGRRELEPGGEAGRGRVLEESAPEAFIRDQLAECLFHRCLAHGLPA